MIQQRKLEIAVGFFMVLGLAALFMLAMRVSNLSTVGLSDTDSGYNVTALFQNIGGLKVRSPVRVAGVRVGQVTGIDLDNRYAAAVRMHIANGYTFPKDTSASIFTSGLLGEQYVSLDPGGDPVLLKNGDVIRATQSALVLERFIGQFLFNKAQEPGSK